MGGDGAQPLQGAADEPGDLHLADPEHEADLRLGQILFEAQPQDLAVARGQAAAELLGQHPLVGTIKARVQLAEAVAERARLVALIDRGVERGTVLGASGLEPLEDLLAGEIQQLG